MGGSIKGGLLRIQIGTESHRCRYSQGRMVLLYRKPKDRLGRRIGRELYRSDGHTLIIPQAIECVTAIP